MNITTYENSQVFRKENKTRYIITENYDNNQQSSRKENIGSNLDDPFDNERFSMRETHSEGILKFKI
jgi:hypothetical protein